MTTEKLTEEKKFYTNGYSDGSGKGTIVENVKGKETGILKTHWGCGCCDSETTKKNNLLANKIIKLLNEKKICDKCGGELK